MSEATPVALRLALPLPLPQLFDYLPPQGMSVDEAWVGCRVEVPFGKRRLVGIVTDVVGSQERELRAACSRLDAQPLLTRELWQTLHWAADYYHRAIGDVLACALPGPLRSGRTVPTAQVRTWRLSAAGRELLPRMRQGAPRELAVRLEAGALSTEQLTEPRIRAALRQLSRRGLVEACDAAPDSATMVARPTLNEEQRLAADHVRNALGGYACLLVDGVTGSGKTEVYLEAISACLARGRQALVLVPEIGLTPQALLRYGRSLPVPVHALHSGLGDGERARAWMAMRSGEGRVLVGTRSAVFCPLPEPGLIIVDEEHDASYKQQEGFRYQARDLALVRGKALSIPVVLGSATPSLESLHRAHSGRGERLVLTQRAGGALPPRVHVLDVRRLPLRNGLSTPLLEAVHACLERGEQALIFRNRRGYAPVLLCHDCGWNAQCSRCSSAMTLHGRGRLVCHHCGARRPAPSSCPECAGLALVPQGAGTERIEQALAEAFPRVPLVRVDRETTRRRDAVQEAFDTLGDRPGLLVGTQMLAKGHDLPHLTLVAIASVDEGLFSADFRASERLAQLLIQVAGRAGRARRRGEVWLQTHHPEHPLLQLLVHHGYAAFAEEALRERAAAGFPPMTHLALLRAEANAPEHVDAFLRRAHALSDGAGRVEVHPPMPAPMPLRAGRHRGQMLFSSLRRSDLQARLREFVAVLTTLPEARRVRWSLDVDPIDLY